MRRIINFIKRRLHRNNSANSYAVTSSSEAPAPETLAKLYSEGWLASYIGDLVSYLSMNQRMNAYFDYWQERGFHIRANHFYEPIPDTRTLRADALWTTPSQLVGINMNDEQQLHLLTESFPAFADEYNAFPTKNPSKPYHFYFDNDLFGGTDALVLYSMVRHFKPNLLIEIGSGVSTTVSAQAALLNGNTEVHAIEPYPNDLLKQGFPGLKSLTVKPIQEVQFSEFDRLKAGDFLFIDTSHVVKINGDVNYLFLDVLPRLNEGVIVHIHDIYLPYEYPKEWVLDLHRTWTEQYLVHAFLLYNTDFEVLFANYYVSKKYTDAMKKTFPQSPWWGGGSFWIRRKARTS